MNDNQDLQGDRLQFLGHLAGGLAHEIKNPLSTININLQLLREDWAKAESPREARALKKIDLLLGEARRLETILDDFLNFARGHRQNPAVMNINTVIQQVVELMDPQVRQHGCSIRVFEGSGLPPVEIDCDSIKQALINLISNAQQAMQDGGEILISTKQVDHQVQIQVTDTGCGISDDMLPRIFRPYHSTKKGGTGLGLPTAKRIIVDHSGSISVISTEGKGSSFSILLPRASQPDLKTP